VVEVVEEAEVGDELLNDKNIMTDIFEKGQKTTMRVALATILFAVTKGVVGVLSGSVVLAADAIHSFADSFSTILAWFGLRIARKKPTEKFQYGYYKAENITALVISGLIFYAAFEIIRASWGKISATPKLTIPFVAIGVSILDAIVMFNLGSWEVKVGREINSQSLIADGSESRMHIFSSSVVLIGLLASYFNVPYIESIAGILISLFILQVGVKSAKDSLFALMDVSPSQEIEEKIKELLKSSSNLQSFENLKLRKSGPFIFGEVRAKIKKFVDVKRAYEIADEIEKKVKAKVPQMDSFLIYTEPAKKLEQKIIIPTKEKRGLDSQIDEYFARAKFFAILKIKKDKIESLEFEENPFREKEIRAGLAIVEYLLEEKLDVLITKEIGPISFHTLRDNLIEVYKTEKDTINQIIKDFLENKLIRLEEPTREKG